MTKIGQDAGRKVKKGEERKMMLEGDRGRKKEWRGGDGRN